MEPIDVVYLWVDGAEDRTRQRLEAALACRPDHHESAVATRRFRDHDELRYSLRSLEQYVPWIRHVYVVTDGTRPTWLGADRARLTVIPHEAIFTDPDDLPTFNSDAIALQLHRITGLSRYFLVVNDDCMFGQPVAREAFLHPDGRAVVYLEAQGPPTKANDDPNDMALISTQRVVETQFEGAITRVFAHTPQLYDRDVLIRLEQMLADEFRRTSAATFRTPRDLVLRVLYPSVVAQFAAIEPRFLSTGSTEYAFVTLTDDVRRSLRVLMHISRMRPRFICFNDDLGDQSVSEFIGVALTRTLGAMYPLPSSFESGTADSPAQAAR